MTQPPTHLNLIKFIYQETDRQETDSIVNRLTSDLDYRDDYECLKEVQSELDGLKRNPSEACIDYIMNYSKRSEALQPQC